jgi:ureidoglycolate hydrolase
MQKIHTKNISSENFKKYGMVVTSPRATPTSQGDNYKFWSDIAHYHITTTAEIGICTVFNQSEIRIDSMERHLKTPEILIPIDAPFVVPLLIDAAAASPESFHVNLGEAVVINEGIWHSACIPIGVEQSSYFVIFRRNTPHDDVQMKSVESFQIVL